MADYLTSDKGQIPKYSFKIKQSSDHDWAHGYIFGDFHVGHKGCDEEGIAEMVSYISQQDPRTTFVILTGDNTENVLPSSKGSAFDLSIPAPSDQIKRAAELLKPISHLVVAGYDGNHSYRSTIATDHSPDKEVLEAMGIGDRFMGYSGYFNIEFSSRGHTQKYTVWGEHGSKNSSTMAGKIRILLNMITLHPDADLYAMGHIHTKLAVPYRLVRVVNRKEVVQKVMCASNGSYLIDAEYAKRSGFVFGGPGVAKIQLCTRRRDIHCSV